MTRVKFCLHCHRHYEVGTGVRGRCGDCGRAYDRELSRQKRARRARNSAAWQKARALARQRDGQRCVSCGATEKVEVHHIIRVADGGDRSPYRTCERSASVVTENSTGGGRGRRAQGSHTRQLAIRETNRSHGRASRAARFGTSRETTTHR
jgi:hypothetical protein